MQKESTAILIRIYIGESDHFKGKALYQYLVEYLRLNQFSGVTVIRGISGFGKASKIHTSDILELSSDLPVLIEVVDKAEKIEELKKMFDETRCLSSSLITEETVKVYQYGDFDK
jgi:hypothetical protein